MERETLLKYLLIIIDLEKSKYTQKQTINSLNRKVASYEGEYNSNSMLNKEVDEQAGWMPTVETVPEDKTGKGLMYFMVYYVGFLGASLGFAVYYILGNVLISVIVALVGGSIPVVVWKNILRKRKQRTIIQMSRAKRTDMELKEIRERRNDELVALIPKLNAEVEVMKATYQNTCQALRKCYDVGIIPEKYQDIVPVSMFYDYILDRRRKTISIQ